MNQCENIVFDNNRSRYFVPLQVVVFFCVLEVDSRLLRKLEPNTKDAYIFAVSLAFFFSKEGVVRCVVRLAFFFPTRSRQASI